MINILAIGNSFSQDATHYLNQIAKEDCVETKVVNLYIGGCSLERHWSNVQSGAEDYLYELNGKSTEKYISIQEALKEERWDYIVTQQASHDSGWTDTYEPFLENLTRYIRRFCCRKRGRMKLTVLMIRFPDTIIASRKCTNA